MIIKIPLLFQGSKGEEHLYMLFDTGSSYSSIRNDLAEKIGEIDKLRNAKVFSTAAEDQFIRVEHRITLDFELNELRLSDEFMVVPGLSEEVIIGVNTLQKWRIKLDFEHETIVTDPRVANLYMKKSSIP